MDAVKILLAEDHPDSREALSTLLRAFGYDVRIATNGREAVDIALLEQPDLILMDVMMPIMDGLTATRTLRADPDFRQVPILAVTAMAGAEDHVFAAGCDAWIRKPVNMRSLVDTIRSMVEADQNAA